MWLDRLEKAVSIPIVRAQKGNIIQDLLTAPKGRFVSVPFFLKHADGSQGMGRRQCTREYKIDVVQKAIRLRLGYEPRKRVKHQVNVNIGISIDEASRMKPSQVGWMTNVFPLIELGLSRADCQKYVEATGLGKAPKSACYICPYRSNEGWKQLHDEEPETFKKAVDFDVALRQGGTAACNKGMNAQQYLHRNLVPLSELPFTKDSRQLDLFDNECEGMCGL